MKYFSETEVMVNVDISIKCAMNRWVNAPYSHVHFPTETLSWKRRYGRPLPLSVRVFLSYPPGHPGLPVPKMVDRSACKPSQDWSWLSTNRRARYISGSGCIHLYFSGNGGTRSERLSNVSDLDVCVDFCTSLINSCVLIAFGGCARTKDFSVYVISE